MLTSVHLAEFPEAGHALGRRCTRCALGRADGLREQVLVALEGLRQNKQIGSSQEAKVQITTSRPDHFMPVRRELAALCIVSEIEVVADPAATSEAIAAVRAKGSKCERCWNYRACVGENPLYPTLCDRCAQVVTALHAPGRAATAPGD